MTTVEAPEVVTRAVAGDRAALADLYAEYQPAVIGYVMKRVKHRELAEDLTADVFVRVLKKIDTFRWQGQDFKAWLFCIARNLIVDYFRLRRNTHEFLAGDAVGGDLDDRYWSAHEVQDDGLPEDLVVDHMANMGIIRHVVKLPEKQRAVIILRFLRDLTQLETAEALGITESQCKALQFRAVRAIARQFPEGRQQ